MAQHRIFISREIDAKVIKDTEDGKTIPQICRAYDLSTRKVIDIRKEYGLDKNHWWENKEKTTQNKTNTFLGELSKFTNILVDEHMKMKDNNDILEPDVEEICIKLLSLLERVKKQ
jgi:galactokinase